VISMISKVIPKTFVRPKASQEWLLRFSKLLLLLLLSFCYVYSVMFCFCLCSVLPPFKYYNFPCSVMLCYVLSPGSCSLLQSLCPLFCYALLCSVQRCLTPYSVQCCTTIPLFWSLLPMFCSAPCYVLPPVLFGFNLLYSAPWSALPPVMFWPLLLPLPLCCLMFCSAPCPSRPSPPLTSPCTYVMKLRNFVISP
jgi:Na+/proline symporter